jgi:hypothetical protein
LLQKVLATLKHHEIPTHKRPQSRERLGA